jgi:hypothetical protein
MARAGGGLIAIWHDISPEGVADFLEWHNREHVPERVAIPGFLRGRRYESVSGRPDWFTLYDVESPAVLASPAYHARLNAPTEWTRRAVDYFSEESRSLCEVLLADGVGAGGIVGTVRFDCDEALDAAILARLERSLRPLLSRPAIVAATVARADLATSRRRSAEQMDREDNRVPRWVLLVEGSTVEAVEAVLDGELGEAQLGVTNTARSIHRLQHDLVRS